MLAQLSEKYTYRVQCFDKMFGDGRDENEYLFTSRDTIYIQAMLFTPRFK